MRDTNFLKWVARDWQRNKKMFMIQTLAFIFNISGYIYMTFALPLPNFLLAYGMYLFGSYLGVIYAVGFGSFPLLLTNLSYLIIEAIGIFKILQYY